MSSCKPNTIMVSSGQDIQIRQKSRAGHRANWKDVTIILPAWFDHLEESSSYKELQFKKVLSACENRVHDFFFGVSPTSGVPL